MSQLSQSRTTQAQSMVTLRKQALRAHHCSKASCFRPHSFSCKFFIITFLLYMYAFLLSTLEMVVKGAHAADAAGRADASRAMPDEDGAVMHETSSPEHAFCSQSAGNGSIR